MKIEKVIQTKRLDAVRKLFREYAEAMDYELCFETLEKELAELPGDYTFEKQGGLWLAVVDSKPAGCIAMKKVDATTCKMKRLWVSKAFRGQQLGQKLVETFIDQARAFGYTGILLVTTDRMQTAIALYERLGFTVTHTDQEYITMALTLSSNR